MLMCLVLERNEIYGITGHCLIAYVVTHRKKPEYKCLIHGGLKGKKEREKEGTYEFQYGAKRKSRKLQNDITYNRYENIKDLNSQKVKIREIRTEKKEN